LYFFSSRRRHTRFDCDWSSDVCSSDLVVSQSNAYRWIVPLNALENVRCRRTWLASYQLDACRVVASGLCSACTAVVEPLHSNRWPLSRVNVMPGSETRSLLPFQPSSA